MQIILKIDQHVRFPMQPVPDPKQSRLGIPISFRKVHIEQTRGGETKRCVHIFGRRKHVPRSGAAADCPYSTRVGNGVIDQSIRSMAR